VIKALPRRNIKPRPGGVNNNLSEKSKIHGERLLPRPKSLLGVEKTFRVQRSINGDLKCLAFPEKSDLFSGPAALPEPKNLLLSGMARNRAERVFPSGRGG
jgi:hypothetical protein